jgi:hypothetical protein
MELKIITNNNELELIEAINNLEYEIQIKQIF